MTNQSAQFGTQNGGLLSLTSSSDGMNFSSSSQCSGRSPSRSVFWMNSLIWTGVWPIRRFAITGDWRWRRKACTRVSGLYASKLNNNEPLCIEDWDTTQVHCLHCSSSALFPRFHDLFVPHSPRFLALLLSMRHSCSASFLRSARVNRKEIMVPAMARLRIKYQCTFWVAIKWTNSEVVTSYTACSKASRGRGRKSLGSSSCISILTQ